MEYESSIDPDTYVILNILSQREADDICCCCHNCVVIGDEDDADDESLQFFCCLDLRPRDATAGKYDIRSRCDLYSPKWERYDFVRGRRYLNLLLAKVIRAMKLQAHANSNAERLRAKRWALAANALHQRKVVDLMRELAYERLQNELLVERNRSLAKRKAPTARAARILLWNLEDVQELLAGRKGEDRQRIREWRRAIEVLLGFPCNHELIVRRDGGWWCPVCATYPSLKFNPDGGDEA